MTYLENHPNCIEESFLIKADYKDFTAYLECQRLDGHWCDEPIVRATADILGTDIHIWHDNGHITVVKCRTQSLLDANKVVIGQVTEIHYVSIRPKNVEYFQNTCDEPVNTLNADKNLNELINEVNIQPIQGEFFPEGLSLARFKTWHESRPWLQATADGKVICTYCTSVKKKIRLAWKRKNANRENFC